MVSVPCSCHSALRRGGCLFLLSSRNRRTCKACRCRLFRSFLLGVGISVLLYADEHALDRLRVHFQIRTLLKTWEAFIALPQLESRSAVARCSLATPCDLNAPVAHGYQSTIRVSAYYRHRANSLTESIRLRT